MIDFFIREERAEVGKGVTHCLRLSVNLISHKKLWLVFVTYVERSCKMNDESWKVGDKNVENFGTPRDALFSVETSAVLVVRVMWIALRVRSRTAIETQQAAVRTLPILRWRDVRCCR